ncbi:dethiobiotin synthetase [Algoriphagus sp. 4150]|uniref:dethiobiotin synthase n=1 Tax=Algoriphagus sp. 4150 TaxID=2817756 RepID=UPI0028577297|nr:dethiobiotin synthase [Algoriphagus sp. 4150]MDR7130200.1 dethiobiotin synthetase [Algoriphagus sp. 4150]
MSTDRNLFITGIGTGVGKTVVSAILTQYLQATYWKPIQAGDLHQSDSMFVRTLIDRHLIVHPERYCLQLPASPHQAAASENISINLSDFELPQIQNSLVVEGAGGLFVPLNNHSFLIDLIEQFRLPAVLVVRDYLGCINHTILSVQALQYRNIPIAYVVFNGTFNQATKEIIKKHIPAEVKLLELPEIDQINKESIDNTVSYLTG